MTIHLDLYTRRSIDKPKIFFKTMKFFEYSTGFKSSLFIVINREILLCPLCVSHTYSFLIYLLFAANKFICLLFHSMLVCNIVKDILAYFYNHCGCTTYNIIGNLSFIISPLMCMTLTS